MKRVGLVMVSGMMAIGVMAEVPWNLYPRPQMVRDNWECLNGEWDYAVTQVSNTIAMPTQWDGKIVVPYAIESELSGVGRNLEKEEFLWYRRQVKITKREGFRTLLHIDSADFRAQAWLGDRELDLPHESMNTPWIIDVTDKAADGDNELTVLIWDPTDYGAIGSTGKQTSTPQGCFYRRCSGILGSVWTELVPDAYIESYKVFPNVANGCVKFQVAANRCRGEKVTIVVKDGGRQIATGTGFPGDEITIAMPGDFKKWSPEHPNLYDFEMCYGKDAVKGYFAMRNFTKGKDAKGKLRFFLNGEPYYVMGTLDQGWWKTGLLTPPDEAAMEFDIRTLKSLGFNSLRKHIKVEPLRYYAICDRLGLMVLQDMPSSFPRDRIVKGLGGNEDTVRYGFYRRDLERVMNNLQAVPSIVMWIPYNEGWGQPRELLTEATMAWVKAKDPTRLVNAPSGWNDNKGGEQLGSALLNDWHGKRHLTAHKPTAADVIDYHNYPDPKMHAANDRRISLAGEFGGITYVVPGHEWTGDTKKFCYTAEKTPEAVEKRYDGMMDMLAEMVEKGLAGSIYTQTSDVEREMNGLITYDRKVVKVRPEALTASHNKVYEAFRKATK